MMVMITSLRYLNCFSDLCLIFREASIVGLGEGIALAWESCEGYERLGRGELATFGEWPTGQGLRIWTCVASRKATRLTGPCRRTWPPWDFLQRRGAAQNIYSVFEDSSWEAAQATSNLLDENQEQNLNFVAGWKYEVTQGESAKLSLLCFDRLKAEDAF